MTTDTSERGLEDLICTAMTGRASVASLSGEGGPLPVRGIWWHGLAVL